MFSISVVCCSCCFVVRSVGRVREGRTNGVRGWKWTHSGAGHQWEIQPRQLPVLQRARRRSGDPHQPTGFTCERWERSVGYFRFMALLMKWFIFDQSTKTCLIHPIIKVILLQNIAKKFGFFCKKVAAFLFLSQMQLISKDIRGVRIFSPDANVANK